MNLGPMIVPRHKFLLFHLLRKKVIDGAAKGWESQVRWTLYDWLTFAIEWKSTRMTLICSKLTCDGNNGHFFAISNEDSALNRSEKDEAVLAVINIDVSCDIKDKVGAIFAVIDIILLFFDWIDFFNFEGSNFIFETIIVRVVFLFSYFWFQNICLKFWRLFNLFLRLLFWNQLLLFLHFHWNICAD